MSARTLGAKDCGDTDDRENKPLDAVVTPPCLPPRCAILAASVGNAFEYYELLIYGYFAITFGKLFPPTGDD